MYVPCSLRGGSGQIKNRFSFLIRFVASGNLCLSEFSFQPTAPAAAEKELLHYNGNKTAEEEKEQDSQND
jgi:hypothetical protein